MTRRQLISLAAGGSAALLLGALAFQYLGGLAPCKLCLWQRWPHGLAVLAGGLGLLLPGVIWPVLGGLGALTSAGIGAYHTGVERGWWPGPTSCSGGGEGLGGLSGAELLSFENAAPVVMCDEVAWELLGLSMASWNVLASLALALIWLRAVQASSSASQ
ncbi:disulfide bond formation protein B [Maritimibacter sp. 55A14]|uniref:disulfide bond formation protein B n=1 Tax=Maritimibacter sp. 55A14 TaxID=2174844 RepID=UPI000D611A37|nr:disulfide bond formation protein B [Maritimibacter sp. 55A14]PWE34191.1 disulfide bond formation protein B [Maritimibacter sp. 55A14]